MKTKAKTMAKLFTIADIVADVNAVGFKDDVEFIQSLSLGRSLVAAGFSDPVAFAQLLQRVRLQDKRDKLQKKFAVIQSKVDLKNPDIDTVLSQIQDTDAQLAQLQD